ncbi:OprD family outer membrane porin [Erwinia sorbitola]|uniref:Outer membrane porin, OprD family n=1 Tax=Erwinia sorbitola TaxID=2681984 RepID=A0A6I6E9T8_9GAMM|nr:OprD family outer membrane porin [Erwinia sorbitola]MTD28389.1 outer membrane porin, OprD family [Erwinia sorbitola]QGU86507.1 outer membrane porin, OprD family [Erwinia sorbitola]
MIVLIIPAQVWAEVDKDNNIKNGEPGWLLNDPFFSQSHMNVSLKNYWKTLNEKESGTKRIHNAWGQGFGFDFKSGYFAGIIGFDATFNSAVKLGASTYFNTRGVLYSKGSGNKKSNAAGYSKFSERYMKLRYKVADVKLKGRWGWQTIKSFGVITNSTRLSSTTYQGVTGSVGYGDLTLRGAYINRSMDRNSPDKKRFQTNTGKYINHIASGDVLWNSDKLNIQYGFGESENYLRRNILRANLKPEKNLDLGIQIYGTHAEEEYKKMPAAKRDFDNNAWHFAVDAKWRGKNWSSKWGLGYTDAKKAHEVGFYPRHMSKNSRGTFTSMAYAGSDYLRDGELMLSTISDYNLTPDLAVGVAGNIGQFNYKGNHVRTGEINFFTRWVPSDPTLKNLTVWAMFGPGWSYKMNKKTPILTKGHYTREPLLSSEMIIEYKFNIF